MRLLHNTYNLCLQRYQTRQHIYCCLQAMNSLNRCQGSNGNNCLSRLIPKAAWPSVSLCWTSPHPTHHYGTQKTRGPNCKTHFSPYQLVKGIEPSGTVKENAIATCQYVRISPTPSCWNSSGRGILSRVIYSLSTSYVFSIGRPCCSIYRCCSIWRKCAFGTWCRA